MFKPLRSAPALLLAVGVALAAPACATGGYYGGQRDARDIERRAYDSGYRQGFENGQRDARDRRDFRIDRDRVYRDADNRRGDVYGRVFQDGYRSGYSEGYERVARNSRRVVPGGPVFGSPGNSNNRGGERYSSPAARAGYRDGVEAGRDDANDRKPYDPRRSKDYREGDRDYDNRYGSREAYKQEYRVAFTQGYEAGYRRQ